MNVLDDEDDELFPSRRRRGKKMGSDGGSVISDVKFNKRKI